MQQILIFFVYTPDQGACAKALCKKTFTGKLFCKPGDKARLRYYLEP